MCRGWTTTSWPPSKRTSAAAAAWRFSSARMPTGRFYNDRLFKDGEGLFPAPLKLPTQLLDRAGEATPDVEVTQHPLFQVLAGRRNGFLPLLMVDYFYALEDDWQPPADGSAQVIARLRNNAPLVIEKKFGKGRRHRPAHQALVGQNAARPLDQLEPQSGVPRAGQRAGELPRRLTRRRPTARHRRRPGRLRRGRQIRIHDSASSSRRKPRATSTASATGATTANKSAVRLAPEVTDRSHIREPAS